MTIEQTTVLNDPTQTYGMGWLRDYPSIRDYTTNHDEIPLKHRELGQSKSIKRMLAEVGAERLSSSLPATADLRPWCSPIENQLNLGSCTANAGVGMVEYYELRAFGTYLNASRLFLYKVTRDLLNWTAIPALSSAAQWTQWRYLACRQKITGNTL